MSELERAKTGNLGQLLLRAARLYNEASVGRVQAFEPRFTVAHTSLFPHLDLEGTRPSDLASRLGISKQAVGQLVQELVEMGTLEKVPDPADGRAKLVVFTDEGREAMLRGLGVLKGVEHDVARHLGDQQVELLKGQLEGLILWLEAHQSLNNLRDSDG